MEDHSPDELLRHYLTVEREGEADRWLSRILDEVAGPLVRRVVVSAVREPSAFSDIDDVVADTMMDLLRRLRDLRGGASQPILDLRRYVVTCAYNRCHERQRERFPARNRLRNQLRYLSNHHLKLALWRNARGELVCGFREAIGREAASSDRIAAIRLPARSDPSAEDRAQVASLALALLREAGGPLTLDALSAAIGRLIGLDTRSPEVPLTELESAREEAADVTLQTRMSLRQLWEDVRRLAPRQRVALLLNLRDVHGRECLSLFPLTRTATIPDIAEAVGMPAQEFAVLWNELPLSDAAIAALLDVTPRQVIKLRRLARERLRRMAKSRADRNFGRHLDSSPRGLTITARR